MATIRGSDIKKVVVACDAGMGSSVMLTSQLSRSLGRFSVTVEHTPVSSIPADADLVLCQQTLVQRARAAAPGKVILTFQMFLGDPVFKELEHALKTGETLTG
jgi:galactose PTS system EIIB component